MLTTNRSTTLSFLFIFTFQRTKILPFSIERNSEFSSKRFQQTKKFKPYTSASQISKSFEKQRQLFGRGMTFAENEKLTFSNISLLLTPLGNVPVWASTLSLGGVLPCFLYCLVCQSAAQCILSFLLKRGLLKPVKGWSSPNPSSPRCCFETDCGPQFHFRRVISRFEMKVDC